MPAHSPFSRSFLISLPAFAAEKDPTYITTDQAAEDPDFAIQGEYAGEIKDEKRGVQIIALGNGKFHAVGYEGGLPGDGFEPRTRNGKATAPRKRRRHLRKRTWQRRRQGRRPHRHQRRR